MDEIEARCLMLIRCYGPCRGRELQGKVQGEVKTIKQALVSLFDKGLIDWTGGDFIYIDVTDKGRARFKSVSRLYKKVPAPKATPKAILEQFKRRQINWADL